MDDNNSTHYATDGAGNDYVSITLTDVGTFINTASNRRISMALFTDPNALRKIAAQLVIIADKMEKQNHGKRNRQRPGE